MKDNLYLIDRIQIDQCSGESCQHYIQVHLKTSSSDEWIRFENKVEPKHLLPFYDLISMDFRKHFCWIDEAKFLIERMNYLHREKINEIHRINDILREEIKELNQEIVKSKFKK